jgi:hypothetical protein
MEAEVTVNWNEPIEAVHNDGRVVPATLNHAYVNYDGGPERVTLEAPDPSTTNENWHEDGSDWCHLNEWRIRNVTAPVLTGGSSPYYSIDVNGVTIECNDLIRALQLPYADGNVLKAVWRIAIDRIGRGKPGTTRLYDAEKIVFFGNDMVEREKANG